MPMRAAWTNNAAEDRWEARIGPYLAVARFDRINRRYLAYVDSHDGRAPDHYAPASFSDPEAAKAWCEAEIERIEAAAHPHGGAARKIAELLREPDPNL